MVVGRLDENFIRTTSAKVVRREEGEGMRVSDGFGRNPRKKRAFILRTHLRPVNAQSWNCWNIWIGLRLEELIVLLER